MTAGNTVTIGNKTVLGRVMWCVFALKYQTLPQVLSWKNEVYCKYQMSSILFDLLRLYDDTYTESSFTVSVHNRSSIMKIQTWPEAPAQENKLH